MGINRMILKQGVYFTIHLLNHIFVIGLGPKTAIKVTDEWMERVKELETCYIDYMVL